MARGAAGIGRGHHTRRRAGHHGVHGGVGDQLGRDRAAVALHDQQVTVEALGGEFRAQARQVAVQHRLDGGIDRRRHATLVLTVLGQDGVTRRHVRIGPQVAHDLGCPAFVRRVDVAVQEVDDDGLAPRRQQLIRRLGHGRLVERHQHLTVGIHAFGHFQPDFAIDHRLERSAQAIGLRPGAAAEFEHVAKAPGGDQADSGDLALQERVGRRGRAMHDGLQRRRIGAGRGKRRHEADGLVVDRRRYLGELDLAGRRVDRQQVGEGAADVYADRKGTL